MSNFTLFFHSIADLVTNPTYLLLMGAFVLLGILLGALPGVSVNMSLILALPLTYNMDSQTAMCVLLACYIGAMSGGLISAIMLNVPGTGASLTTTFDGHPMAEQGRGSEAIGVGILTSFVGGTLSFVLLIFVAPFLASIAMSFGPWEYFAIGIFSLTMIITVAGDDLVKGILASFFGMLLATTGTAPVDGVVRYSFGLHALDGGVTTTALMCGMFAIPELFKLARNVNDQKIARYGVQKIRGYGIAPKKYLSQWKNILRSSALGAYVGLLPGIGAASASMLSYMTAKNQSKNPEEFGKGSLEGLISSETANNACIGGSMMPMLALGVPGSAASAIVMSALNMHNIQCGPLAFSRHADLIYMIFAICFVANIFMLILERLLMNGYVRILTIDRRIIMVIVIMMCFVGAYCARNNYTDAYMFVIGGVLGYFLQKAGIGRAPIVLGYILCGMVEKNLLQGMGMSRGNFFELFTHPIAVGFLLVAALAMANEIRKRRKKAATQKTAAAS